MKVQLTPCKLGYGGTKAEMNRLLRDAEKLAGYKPMSLDANNFADVVDAIHIIQEDLGIAGTTAKEASETISGSLASMKSAWQNLVVGIADENANFDTLVGNFVDSVATVGENVIPRVEQALQGVGMLVEGLAPVVAEAIPTFVSDVLPTLLSSAVSLVSSIGGAIIENLPTIANTAIEMVKTIADKLSEPGNIENFIVSAFTIISQIVTSIGQALPELIPAAVSIIVQLVESILDNIDLIIDAAISLIKGLATGIVEALPHLIKAVPVILENLVTAIIENVPILLEGLASALGELLTGIIDSIGGEGTTEKILDWFRGIPDAISTFFSETLPGVIDNIVQWFESIPQWFDELPSRLGAAIGTSIGTVIKFGLDVYDWATTELPGIVEGIAQWFADLPGEIGEWLSQAVQRFSEWASNLAQTASTEIPQLVDDIITGFSELPQRIVEVGSQIVNGLWDGIQSGWDWLVGKVEEFAHSLIDAAKSVLGIASPSKVFRDQVGKWLPLGMEEGFEDEMPKVQKDLQSSLDSMTGSLSANIETSGINLGNGAVPSFSDSSEKIVINVYCAQGQSITELVDEIERRLAFKQRQRKAAMA